MPLRGEVRDDHLLSRYLGEIDAHAPITEDEESDLGSVIRAGGVAATAARRRLLQAHLKLVSEIAQRRSQEPEILLDLIHEGNLGLLRAVDRFDPARGSSFAAYATWWVRRAIARAFDETTKGLRRPEHASWDEAATADNISFALLDRLAAPRPGPEIDDTGEFDDPSGPFDITAAALDRHSFETQIARLRPDEQHMVRARFGWIEASTPPGGTAVDADDPELIEAVGMSKLRHPSTARLWSRPSVADRP